MISFAIYAFIATIFLASVGDLKKRFRWTVWFVIISLGVLFFTFDNNRIVRERTRMTKEMELSNQFRVEAEKEQNAAERERDAAERERNSAILERDVEKLRYNNLKANQKVLQKFTVAQKLVLDSLNILGKKQQLISEKLTYPIDDQLLVLFNTNIPLDDLPKCIANDLIKISDSGSINDLAEWLESNLLITLVELAIESDSMKRKYSGVFQEELRPYYEELKWANNLTQPDFTVSSFSYKKQFEEISNFRFRDDLTVTINTNVFSNSLSINGIFKLNLLKNNGSYNSLIDLCGKEGILKTVLKFKTCDQDRIESFEKNKKLEYPFDKVRTNSVVAKIITDQGFDILRRWDIKSSKGETEENSFYVTFDCINDIIKRFGSTKVRDHSKIPDF